MNHFEYFLLIETIKGRCTPERGCNATYSHEDAISMVLNYLATNDKGELIGARYGVSASTVSRIIAVYLPVMARVTDDLWGPKGPASRVRLSEFRYASSAVGTLDSTPIRVCDAHDEMKRLQRAMWNHKHNIAAWMLHALVSPDGLFVWRMPLYPGGRHDARAFAQSAAPDAFSYCARRAGRNYVYARYPIIADAGYRGIPRCYHEALVKNDATMRAAGLTVEQFDHDRVVVECAFGVLKGMFRCLGDEGFRLCWDLLEPAVTTCIAIYNWTRVLRGHALDVPPVYFVSHVPRPIRHPPGQPSVLPQEPKHYDDDSRVGLTPESVSSFWSQHPRRDPLADLEKVTWDSDSE